MTVHEFSVPGVIDTNDPHTRTFLRTAISSGAGGSYWETDEDEGDDEDAVVLHATDDEGDSDEAIVSLDDMAAAACKIIAARPPYYSPAHGTQCADIRYLTEDIRNGILYAFLFSNRQYDKLESGLSDVLLQVATFGEVLYDDENTYNG